MKLLKRSGKFLPLLLKDGKILCENKIGQRDTIFFTCKKCKKDGSRRVSLFKNKILTDRDFYCEQCNREQNYLDKYGVKNPMQRKDVVEVLKKSNLKKYGFDNPQKVKKIRNKTDKTMSEKYGGNAPICSAEIKQKIIKTNLKKYGVKNILQLYQREEIIKRKTESYKKLNEMNDVIILTSLENYKGLKNSYKFKCKKCGNVFIFYINSAKESLICRKCNPVYRSNQEKEIALLLEKNNIEIKVNDRNLIYPYELDIYNNEKKIAIEFNGLYWHSENVLKNKEIISPRQYHLRKTKMCQEKGIKLFHFFEDEWLFKKEIVKSMIKNAFSLYKERIFARKTKIKEISLEKKNKFMNENHLQGTDNSNICLGLIYNNEIVSVMSFNKGKNKVKNQYELSRFASKINTQIIGGASKLLKYFIRKNNPDSIYSFSDLRISSGELYKKIGFEFERRNPPAYWYFKNSKRIHRFNFRKSRLKTLFPDLYSNDKTEWQIMKEANYDRIWDCGNDKWVLDLTKN